MSRSIWYIYDRAQFEAYRAECEADQSEKLFYSTGPNSFDWGFETVEYRGD